MASASIARRILERHYISLGPHIIIIWIVNSAVCATAASFEHAARHCLRTIKSRGQVPARIKQPRTFDFHSRGALLQAPKLFQALLQIFLIAERSRRSSASLLASSAMNLVRTITAVVAQTASSISRVPSTLLRVNCHRAALLCMFRCGNSRPPSKHKQVGKRITS